MKKILLLIYMMFPVLVMAQGHKGEVDECAPMKNGKVCYSDDVEIENTSKLEIFNAINAWAKQAEAVSKEIKNAKGDYVLVCGDFNDTPISYAHRTIQGDLTDAFAESGRGMGITYNQNFFWFRIDNILHSPNMTSMNCSVRPRLTSRTRRSIAQPTH